MKKPPSFGRFLLIMVFILEGLSLAIVIGFLFAMLDQSMQQEKVSRINVQQAEMRLYLADRLNYTYNRVKEIRFNNNIKIALLLGMHAKIAENMQNLYPGTKGSAFYVRSLDGRYFPQPSEDHNFLNNKDRVPFGLNDEIRMTVNPHTFVYAIPIIQQAQIKGHAVGIYDPSIDPHFIEHAETFKNLSLVYKHDEHLTDLFTHQPLAVSSHQISEELSQHQYRLASDECLTLLVGLREFPSLFLMVDTQKYRHQRWSMVSKLILLCIPLLVLTFTFSFLILKRVTSALDVLAKNALHIAQNDEHSELDTTNIRHAEFIHLSQAFNKVLSTVRQRTQALRKTNKDLQNKIDETNRLETQLRQARKMEALGTLAGGIAHDFNNILYAIIGYCELAMDDAAQDTIQQDNLDQAIAGARRAVELVQQILTFARQTDIKKHPINLTIIVKESLKLIRATLPTSIEIQTKLDEQITVLADPTQMHQIIVNMCTNASHAMRDNEGVLTISLENMNIGANNALNREELRQGRHACLRIEDTGHGMAAEILERIFDPYYTTKEQGEGSGMGLSVVQGIVHGLNGAISVESVLGKGSTFNIYLPALDKQETVQVADNHRSQSIVGGQEHILFVDDELPLTRMVTQMLCNMGYSVAPYNNPIKALEDFRLSPEQFDLVISDVTMPQMNGPDMAREMMKIRPDLPILLCTGYSANCTEKKASDIGVSAMMHKPLVRQELSATIRSLLDERPPD